MRKLLCLLPLLLAARVVAQIPVQHCAIMNWSQCTNGSPPTPTCVQNSIFGATIDPTGSVAIAGTAITTTTSAQFDPWFGVTPTCAPGLTSTSLGQTLTIPSGGGTNDTTVEFQNLSTGNHTASESIPFFTNIPQNAATLIQYYDTADIIASTATSGHFVNFQFGNSFTPGPLDWFMECGGCAGGGSPPTNRVSVPSNTWVIINLFATPTGSYIGLWSSSTGKFTPNTLASAVSTSYIPSGFYVGKGVGSGFPAGDVVNIGTVAGCGFVANETVCPFPFAPGLQRLAPTLSLAGGSYSTPQSGITLTDLDGLGQIYYTLDGSTPSCTLGANDTIGTCNGTLYSGSLPTLYITTKVQAIDCLSNYQCSTVTTATYTITQGAGFLASNRSIDWTQLGACPGSPSALPDQGCVPLAATTWTQVGSTIAACGSLGLPVSPTACGITSTLLNSCTGGAYILLAGTPSAPANFYLNGNISITKNQCEIRGGGPSGTHIFVYGAGGCNAGPYFACIQGSSNFANGEQNHATWTAGFTPGSTSITLSNSLNMAANASITALDQQGTNTDTGQIFPCVSSGCGAANSSGAPRTDNTCSSAVSPNYGQCPQVQYVLVTACSPSCNNAGSTTLTISPALGPNWSSANSTGAWWATNVIQQSGIRDLTIDMTNATNGTSPVSVNNAYRAFVYQIETIDGARNHVSCQFSKNTTYMNSYAYGQQTGFTGTSSYAFEALDCDETLAVNNIAQQVVEQNVNTGGAGDNGFAYNFPVSSISNSTAFMTQMEFDHGGGDLFDLREGNIGSGIEHDNTHGSHALFTEFRNFFNGWAPASSCNGTACSTNTVADCIYGGSRYGNVAYNVAGQAGYHTARYLAPSSASNGACGFAGPWKTVFVAGGGPSTAAFCIDATNCAGGTQGFDTLAQNSLMLWNNYDTVTGGTVTGALASAFGDSTGSTSTMAGLASPGTPPPSVIFAGKPWFEQNAGTAVPWPVIGPDVTSGNLLLCTAGTYTGSYVDLTSKCGTGGATSTAAGGHVNMNAAAQCYLDTMAGTPDGSGVVLNFNPAVCYNASVAVSSTSSFSGVQGIGLSIH